MNGKSVTQADHLYAPQTLDADSREILALQANRMREVLREIGPITAWTDVIADVECLLRGEPTLLYRTPEEWLRCTERLLRGK